MANLFKLLAFVPDIPSLLGLISDISAAIKDKTEARIDVVINDLKPFVEKWCPGVTPTEVDAAAGDLIALVTLKANHSAQSCATVAAVIVESLPKFGLPLTQEHADNLVKALADALGDLGLLKA